MTEDKSANQPSLPLAPSSQPMTCRRCGTCCTMHQAFASPDDIERISAFLGITTAEWEERYADPRWGFDIYRLIRHTDGACAFLTWENGLSACAIHEVKPVCCSKWQAGFDKKECRAGLERHSE